MLRLFILTISMLFPFFVQGKSSYQIDLIVFAHPKTTANNLAMKSPILPISKNAIPLKAQSDNFYALLGPSKSSLHDEYYLLSRRSRFQVLGHYSWKQPDNSDSAIALPNTERNGWFMQGTVRVKKSNYYLLDTELQFSPPDNPQSSFIMTQKQRIKADNVYFLDHPQIGMLIKIHKLT